MKLTELKKEIPKNIYEILENKKFEELRPSQTKAIKQGLFKEKNQLICTPTASGKTLVAEMSFLNTILNKKQKAVYIVPLRALATEKYYSFKETYTEIKTGLSTGELDSEDTALGNNDLIIVTSEKFDSLLRHKTPWIKKLGTIIIDEIHLLNDPNRGPTLEIVIAILKKELPKAQIIGLSATIGNPEQLAQWLNAELIKDTWRPVKLKKGVYLEGEIHFKE
ncbi:DEAD/DEAH box helicase [Candidatus Woesearchaeota archaeon]|nr:DEAD/DEAH box helicase [Candidatus Woesearchaeota archaeon]